MVNIMVKVVGPMLSLSATGKFGKHICFAGSLGGPVVKNYRKKYVSKSDNQLRQRGAMRVISFFEKEINLNNKGRRGSDHLNIKEYLENTSTDGSNWCSQFYKRGFPEGIITLNKDFADYARLPLEFTLSFRDFNFKFKAGFVGFKDYDRLGSDIGRITTTFVFLSALSRCGYLDKRYLDAREINWDFS